MVLHIIAGKYKGRRLYTPKQNTTRPTQSMLREAVFNICQWEMEGAHLLDLYAGSGAIGFEALSRGASHVTFVEKGREAISSIQKNKELLDCASQITLIRGDAMSSLSLLKGPFHIIYLDPPYDLNTTPILEEIIKKKLLIEGGSLFLEEREDPKTKKQPFESEELLLKKTRTFGSARLTHYIKK